MTDVMREMIAQLMGASREEEEGRRLPPFDHHSVCRAYLLESCPKELLTDTRLEGFINCRKLHEPAHKADYQREQEKRDLFYDIEAFEALDEAVRVVDIEVDKIREKVRRDAEQSSDSQEFIKSQKVHELNEKIGSTLADVEKLGSEGKVQESMEALKAVEDLKRKKLEIESELKSIAPVQQRLRVCEDCGAQLNILDHESRLADHYGGKMHLGMVDIREKWSKLKETVNERRVEKRQAEDKYRQERRDRNSKERERDRSSRDRERDRSSRDRERDRNSRERDRDRRHRDRSKSRSPRRSGRRSRSRSPAREHKRSRRDRSSSRERDRGRRSGRY